MLQSVAFLKDRNHTEQNYEEQPLLQQKTPHFSYWIFKINYKNEDSVWLSGSLSKKLTKV